MLLLLLRFSALLLVLSLPLLARTPQLPYSPLGEVVGAKALKFKSNNSSFVTTSKSDDQGNDVALTDKESFMEFNSMNSVDYGVSEKLDVGIFLNYRYVQTDNSQYSGQSYGGLESAGGRLKYFLGQASKINYSLLGEFSASLVKNDYYPAGTTLNDDVSLGDDATESRVGLGINRWLSKHNVLSMQALFNYRGSDFASEVLYKIENAQVFTRWAFHIGLEGIQSLENDPYTSNPLAKPIVKTGGVTHRINSINRSLLSGYIGLNYSFGDLIAGLQGKRVLYAVSNDYGNEVLFNISFGTRPKKTKVARRNQFKSYEGEGRVIKISPKKSFIKVDKGVIGNFEEGMSVDIFEADYFGKNVLVARGVVHKAKSSFSIIRVLKVVPGQTIKKHMVARSY